MREHWASLAHRFCQVRMVWVWVWGTGRQSLQWPLGGIWGPIRGHMHETGGRRSWGMSRGAPIPTENEHQTTWGRRERARR